MMLYKATVVLEALSAADAAKVVQRKVEGRNKTRTASVLRVEDLDGRVLWKPRGTR